MNKVMVLYRMVAKPGHGEDVVNAFEDDLFDVFGAEPGTELYVLSRSLDDPDVLWCSEVFTTRAAFEEHRSSDISQRLAPKLRDLLASSEAIIGTPLKATGLAL